MSAPCPHGMPTAGACFQCMEDGNMDPPPRPPAVTVERTLTARYDGHCRGCNLEVHAGQRIALMSDGSYRHEGCT